MIVLHLLQLNGSVNYHRKWKLISSEVGVKLKNRENSKFSLKKQYKCGPNLLDARASRAGAPGLHNSRNTISFSNNFVLLTT